MEEQVHVTIGLDAALLRRALELLEERPEGHGSLDGLMEELLRDFVAEGPGDAPQHRSGTAALASAPRLQAALETSREPGLPRLLAPPPEDPVIELAPPGRLEHVPLSFLTNRVSPLKISTRVLSNLALAGEWPPIEDFQRSAARTARELGLRLRAKDDQAEARAYKRRAIGYPVGRNERAALDRYIVSFTLQGGNHEATGPLAVLGLAGADAGRARLTEVGWRLAAAPSPLTDGAEGMTLSADEILLIRAQLRRSPSEADAIRHFLHAVRDSAGHQSRVDARLQEDHPSWSAEQVIAQRSAMIGRLGEVRLLKVDGRGTTAKIQLLRPSDAYFD